MLFVCEWKVKKEGKIKWEKWRSTQGKESKAESDETYKAKKTRKVESVRPVCQPCQAIKRAEWQTKLDIAWLVRLYLAELLGEATGKSYLFICATAHVWRAFCTGCWTFRFQSPIWAFFGIVGKIGSREILTAKYFYNIFTINHRLLVVIGSDLNLILKLFFCPNK